jgi:hypothetical protein
MSRLPESRIIALKANKENDPDRALIKQEKKLVSLSLFGLIPFRTAAIGEWPKKTTALCLHCAEVCPSAPLPAVKYHDAQEDKFWVYGYFCRPGCAIAYVMDQPNMDNCRCALWTQSILRNYFGVKGPMQPAPPRCLLKKFGGKLTLEEFYGTDGSVFTAMHEPPFVTYAMFAEIRNNGILPVEEDKSTKGLRRPLQRTTPIASQEMTEKTPAILEFLALKGAAMQQTAKPQQQEKKRKKTGEGLSKYFTK